MLCLIGTIILLIPAVLMWDLKPANSYYEGVWGVYEQYFNVKI